MRIPFERYIPHLRKAQWTWIRLSLLAIALFSLIDSMFVPLSRDVDPGRASERILSLILAFRATSVTEPSVPVLVAGVLLAAEVSALNHLVLPPWSFIWTPVGLFLLILFMVSFLIGKHNPGPTV